MRPSFHPEGQGRLYDQNEAASDQKMLQLWHQSGRCPANTVPIRRTRKDDMLRASSINKYGRKKHKSTPNPLSVDPDLLNESGHQVQKSSSSFLLLITAPLSSVLSFVLSFFLSFSPRLLNIYFSFLITLYFSFFYGSSPQHAIAYVEGDKYYGAKATINVWEPDIEQGNEFSLSQLWILGGSFGQDLNSIEAGWQVKLNSPYITPNYNLIECLTNIHTAFLYVG